MIVVSDSLCCQRYLRLCVVTFALFFLCTCVLCFASLCVCVLFMLYQVYEIPLIFFSSVRPPPFVVLRLYSVCFIFVLFLCCVFITGLFRLCVCVFFECYGDDGDVRALLTLRSY